MEPRWLVYHLYCDLLYRALYPFPCSCPFVSHHLHNDDDVVFCHHDGLCHRGGSEKTCRRLVVYLDHYHDIDLCRRLFDGLYRLLCIIAEDDGFDLDLDLVHDHDRLDVGIESSLRLRICTHDDDDRRLLSILYVCLSYQETLNEIDYWSSFVNDGWKVKSLLNWGGVLQFTGRSPLTLPEIEALESDGPSPQTTFPRTHLNYSHF